jgi:hypothetical protein
MWVWKRKQGVCSGRLKPITDIQVMLSYFKYKPVSNIRNRTALQCHGEFLCILFDLSFFFA